MEYHHHLLVAALVLSLSWSFTFARTTSFTVFDVRKFGAVGDGRTDDTNAFLRAWKATCSAEIASSDDYYNKSPLFYVPRGYKFLLQHLEFTGPCTSYKIHVNISGTLVAPEKLWKWTGGCTNEWIGFERVRNVKVFGRGGKILANGHIWWNRQNIQQFLPGCTPPTSMRFHACDGMQLRDIQFINSPRNHISISGTNRADISNIRITAPENSPNTDGIDLSHVSDIHIHHSIIQTGDDCVAINGGSSKINITNVHCGPGHGISVGSLGKNGGEDNVEQIHVAHCTLQGTQNGVRIKTWPGGRGYAKDITFYDITMIDSRHPIIIDQAYCGGTTCDQPDTSAVKISNVTYSNIRGTSQDVNAVSLICSANGGGCRNIVMKNVVLKSSSEEGNGWLIYGKCENVHGSARNVSPQVGCLESKPELFW